LGWLSLKDLGRIGAYEVCKELVVIVDILFVIAALLCEEEKVASSRGRLDEILPGSGGEGEF
jgi:hypothetical protein